jgi:hypothetical protein
MSKNKITQELVKLRQRKKLMLGLIFALVAIFVWVVASLFSTKSEQILSSELVKLAQPLVPTLDQKLLKSLESKQSFSDEQLQRFSIYALVETEIKGEMQLIDVVQQRVVTQEKEQEDAKNDQASPDVEGDASDSKEASQSGMVDESAE